MVFKSIKWIDSLCHVKLSCHLSWHTIGTASWLLTPLTIVQSNFFFLVSKANCIDYWHGVCWSCTCYEVKLFFHKTDQPWLGWIFPEQFISHVSRVEVSSTSKITLNQNECLQTASDFKEKARNISLPTLNIAEICFKTVDYGHFWFIKH